MSSLNRNVLNYEGLKYFYEGISNRLLPPYLINSVDRNTQYINGLQAQLSNGLTIEHGGTGASSREAAWNNIVAEGGTITGELLLKPTGASLEGGEISLDAPEGSPTQAGIHIDNYDSTLRIFGIPSADETTFVGIGRALKINPYNRTITGDYNFVGIASKADEVNITLNSASGTFYPALSVSTSYNSLYQDAGICLKTEDLVDTLTIGQKGTKSGKLCLYTTGNSNNTGILQIANSGIFTFDSAGTVITNGNINSYALPKTGGFLTGNLTIAAYPSMVEFIQGEEGRSDAIKSNLAGLALYSENYSTEATLSRTVLLQSCSYITNAAEAFVLIDGSDGSGIAASKLIYTEHNIVASTTEPTNPVRGMIWLELEA